MLGKLHISFSFIYKLWRHILHIVTAVLVVIVPTIFSVVHCCCRNSAVTVEAVALDVDKYRIRNHCVLVNCVSISNEWINGMDKLGNHHALVKVFMLICS